MFDFDPIIAKIPLAEEYKIKHYYDDYYQKCWHSSYTWDRHIHVVDNSGKEGYMTNTEFCRFVKIDMLDDNGIFRLLFKINNPHLVGGTYKNSNRIMKIKHLFREVTYVNENWES